MPSRRLNLFLLLAAAAFLAAGIIQDVAFGQRRTSRNRQRPAAQAARIDYSQFSHSTQKHRQDCKTCHRVPTENWKATTPFPDVADYPDHDACVRCHRQQFFRGAKPAICSVCHTKVSPRHDGRFSFRKPGLPTQFNIEFPHDRHQDVIAATQREPTFIKTAFYPMQSQERTYNNCAICHVTRDEPATPRGGWVDSYVPDKLTFKGVPVGHGSCFNCHWNSEEPVKSNCAGCHKLGTSPVAPSSIRRISMKFKHDGGGEKRNHVAECTTCHINITKASSLRGLKPDVPITACTECHNREGLRLDLSKELEAVDKNRSFVCVYCHTSDVGRRDPPSSHYLIVDRPPQLRGN